MLGAAWRQFLKIRDGLNFVLFLTVLAWVYDFFILEVWAIHRDSVKNNPLASKTKKRCWNVRKLLNYFEPCFSDTGIASIRYPKVRLT